MIRSTAATAFLLKSSPTRCGSISACFVTVKFTMPSIGLSSIVARELYFGAHKSAKVQHNLETLRLLFAGFPILDFDQRDAFTAGEVRAVRAVKGTPIGPYNALIAGQAKARGLVLVTNNLDEFNRVDGLRVEDWSVDQGAPS